MRIVEPIWGLGSDRRCVWDFTEEEHEARMYSINVTFSSWASEEEVREWEERCGCKGPEFPDEEFEQMHARMKEIHQEHPHLFPQLVSKNTSDHEPKNASRRRRKRYSRNNLICFGIIQKKFHKPKYQIYQSFLFQTANRSTFFRI